MIDKLEQILPEVLESIRRGGAVREWNSLVINRRKPTTYRAYRQFGDYRVCLHAFDPCSPEECFAHPHPWPGAFLLLKGEYLHRIGYSSDLKSEPSFHFEEIVRPYSIYSIQDRRTWHTVQPLVKTYTVMLNGAPWDKPHSETRTTKGKDLEEMTPNELGSHLVYFDVLLGNYLRQLSQHENS